MLPELAVIVVNYGSTDLLQECLAQVADDVSPGTVVVVDSYSTPGARADAEWLCEKHGWVGVFPDHNTGFGVGCNLGAEAAVAAGATKLLFLNPDATIGLASTRLLLEVVTSDPDCLAAPRVLTPDGRVWSAGTDVVLDTGDMRSWRRRDEHPNARVMPWVSGACLMVDAERWLSIGGFDPDYFLYWEDVDLCARWLAAGRRLVLVSDACAIHSEGATHNAAGSRALSSVYYLYNARNRELFAAKWLTRREALRWRLRAPLAAYRVLLRGGRRQFLHPVAPLTAVARGLWEGFRWARQLPPTERARSSVAQLAAAAAQASTIGK